MRNILELLFQREERENLILILEICKTLLRDMLMVKIKEDGLINFDLFEDIKKVSEHWDLKSILIRMDLIHQTVLAIRNNANTRVAIRALMISWNKGSRW